MAPVAWDVEHEDDGIAEAKEDCQRADEAVEKSFLKATLRIDLFQNIIESIALFHPRASLYAD
jgi:hypothetical protein